MLNVRLLTTNDYDDHLLQWWKQWRFPAPPRDFLPQDGTGGLMIEKDGIPVVAGFLYLTNSKVAWSEFIVSNFDIKDRTLREEAIYYIIDELCRIAYERNAKYIYTTVKNKNLVKHYEARGFVVGSRNVDEMVRVLG